MIRKIKGNLYFHAFNCLLSGAFFMGKRVSNLSSVKADLKFKLLLATISIFFCMDGYSQIWQETFGPDEFDCGSQGTLADGYDSGVGTWTIANLAPNGPIANVWYVSNATLGNPFDGDCTQNCGGFFGGGRTLHIGPAGNDVGAQYEEFGNSILAQTNKRVESPLINCSGASGIDVTFLFTHNPPNSIVDRCFFQYSSDGGVNWQDIQQLPLVAPGFCGPGSQQWDLITINLPASADNNPNVKIGFRWFNDDIGTMGLKPSVAIDEIAVNADEFADPPVADFSVLDPQPEYCEQSCITLIDESTFHPFSNPADVVYSWTFENGDPATSNNPNPTVCFNDPGTYDITLVVTDNIGASAPITQTVIIADCGPDFNISVSNDTPCANEQCIDVSSEGTTGNNIDPASWQWVFTSEDGTDVVTVLGEANPTGVCLNQIGFYDLTVTATDDDLTETVTIQNIVEVLDCSGPDIDFTASQLVICPEDCIQFTDQSTTNSTITEWQWFIPGGLAEGEDEPGFTNQQNPLVCYDTPGTYWVKLVAVDAEGPSARPDSIQIVVDPCTGPPQANFTVSDTVICTGDCVNFQDQSLGLINEHLWIFAGINEVSSEENPQVICYDEPGLYTVTLTVANDVDPPDQLVREDYIRVESCINPPVPRIEVAQDTICAGDCVDYFSQSTGLGSESFQYEWTFQGAVDGTNTSTDENPEGICYDNAGSFSVALTVTRPGGDDSTRVFQNIITVVATPECRPTIEATLPDTICGGDCAFFSANFIDADSVRWTFVGGDPETSTAFEPGLVCYDSLGTFPIIVEAYNPAGASSPIFETIFVGQRPPLSAGPDRTINAGAVIELTGTIQGEPEPEGEFTWQPFDLVDNFRAQTVETSPTETTQYIVYYKEPGSCTAVDTVTVFVNFIAAVGVPTAFSPNGDGLNDELRVLGQGISRMEFKVFNRYGQLVFETTNQSDGWDGTFKDTELNPGTFVYTLEVTFAEGQREVYTGDVTLVR